MLVIAAAFTASLAVDGSHAKPVTVSDVLPEGSWVAVSQRLRLVADSQLHEFHGAPTYLQSAEVDKLVEVALRPSQQRMFAPDLLRQSLSVEGVPKPDVVLHLGDAIDVSCTSEWELFTTTMTASPAPWLLAPGNHDGYFTGNLLPPAGKKTSIVFSRNYGSEGWRLRCGPVSPALRNGARLDKPALLKAAIETSTAVLGLADASCSPGLCKVSADGRVEIRAEIDSRKPWASYLIQKVGISPCAVGDEQCLPLVAILLDTSTYAAQPTFVSRPAGHFASLSAKQLAVLDTWLREHQGNAIVAGHHTLSNFEDTERQRLVKSMCDAGALLYVSAHTHVGYWRSWTCDSGRTLLELNIGSVLDWPAHHRDFVVLRSDSGALAIDSPVSSLGDPSDPKACHAEWLPKDGSGRTPEEQQLYQVNGTSVKLGREALNRGLKAELLEYRELIRLFPTIAANAEDASEEDGRMLEEIVKVLDHLERANLQAKNTRGPPQRLILQLQEFESTRRVANEIERQRYKVCLGLWAAKRDHARAAPLEKRRRGGKGDMGAQVGMLDRSLRYAILR